MGSDLSLKQGLGAMAFSRKPPRGWRPSGVGRMQMVPPVAMIRTRDSGWLHPGYSLSERASWAAISVRNSAIEGGLLLVSSEEVAPERRGKVRPGCKSTSFLARVIEESRLATRKEELN